ncbi:MAG TPA: formyltransferase family protein [Anaerolineales bacterium]|nr:formyltransferase family protein [Anaerolineales bacterium]
MPEICIFSPNRYSLYTTTVTALLIRRGIKIQTIYVRNLLNPKRFINEYRRDGSRLITKIWKKLVLREAGYQRVGDIRAFREEQGIKVTDLFEFKKDPGIPVIQCNDLNDPVVIEGLKILQPDLVIFTGGGLLRQEILSNSGHGVINCHMGVLPLYRGMDVVEWPILEGNPDKLGITVHFMDKGIDTGDILRIVKIPPLNGETIRSLRDRIEPIMCKTIVDTCIDFLDGKLTRKPQRIMDGKQYFKMHPTLMGITQGLAAKDNHDQ